MPSTKHSREGIENGLLAKLLEIHHGKPDVVPKNHRTSEQWAKAWGVTLQKTQDLIKHGVKEGLMGSKKYRIQSKRRGLYPVPHYFEL